MKRYMLIAAMLFICANVYAADVPGPAKTTDAGAKAKDAVKAEPQKKLTREEKIAGIIESLSDYPDIASTIEGLESQQEAGATAYTYNKKKLTDLDDDNLTKLASAVRRRATMEHMRKIERQQSQLRMMQQAQQLNRMQRIATPPAPPPAPPKVVVPPKPPVTRR